MKPFYTRQVEVKCGEINEIDGKSILVGGKKGETAMVGGEMWLAWAIDWWNAQTIGVGLYEKDLLKRMCVRAQDVKSEG